MRLEPRADPRLDAPTAHRAAAKEVTDVVSTARDVLTEAYDAFNARDIERALAAMHPAVAWPNGMEGGYVHGHDGVRDYWTRQWRQIDPRVEPRRFTTDDTGHVVVDVHQVIRDRSGHIVTDRVVQHVYVIESGLIKHMEIRAQ